MTRVLVTDGDERAALAVVRSLGRAGYDVHVCARHARSLAGSSRYAGARFKLADPLRDPVGYAEGVRTAVAKYGIEIIVPISDAATLALLPLRGELPDVLIAAPPLEAFRSLSDKAEVLRVAAEEGIAVPQQTVLHCADDLVTSALEYPVVVKPARSVTEVNGARRKWTVSHARGPDELTSRLASLGPDAFPVLVQQRIVGPGVGVFALLWKEAPVALFSHQRVREKPPSGGVSVYSESLPLDPDLLDASLRLLKRFGWSGVAMVEYKLSLPSGTPYLMEVNGRFWGSLQLAISAGVDFPSILMSVMTGGPVPAPADYTVGIRNRWWWGDFDHLVARVRRSAAELDLPPDTPGRLHALRDFLRLRRGDMNEVLRIGDPAPFLLETWRWLRRQ